MGMSLFIQSPLLALLPALLFLALYRLLRRRSALFAACAWLLYAVYELGMSKRWLCSGECNIRVDLLLIYPLLALTSIVAIVAAARGRVAGS
jgi:hypothetical protein